MPASETSAIAAPSASRRSSTGRALRRIVLVIGRERRRDGVAVEQLAGDAGVLAGDQVGAGQRFQRAQRDVAEIADRGGDDMQPGRKLADVDRLAAKRVSGVASRSCRRGAIARLRRSSRSL